MCFELLRLHLKEYKLSASRTAASINQWLLVYFNPGFNYKYK